MRITSYKVLQFLKLFAIGHIIGGLVVSGLWWIKPLHQGLITLLYGQPQPQADQMIFWLAILGPTVASWGILCFSLIQQYQLYPSKRIIYTLIAATLIWAPLDALLGVSNGLHIFLLIDGAVVLILLSCCLILLKNYPLTRHPVKNPPKTS